MHKLIITYIFGLWPLALGHCLRGMRTKTCTTSFTLSRLRGCCSRALRGCLGGSMRYSFWIPSVEGNAAHFGPGLPGCRGRRNAAGVTKFTANGAVGRSVWHEGLLHKGAKVRRQLLHKRRPAARPSMRLVGRGRQRLLRAGNRAPQVRRERAARRCLGGSVFRGSASLRSRIEKRGHIIFVQAERR